MSVPTIDPAWNSLDIFARDNLNDKYYREYLQYKAYLQKWYLWEDAKDSLIGFIWENNH